MISSPAYSAGHLGFGAGTEELGFVGLSGKPCLDLSVFLVSKTPDGLIQLAEAGRCLDGGVEQDKDSESAKPFPWTNLTHM